MVQEITLIFKYEQFQPMKFRFILELGDYETFYSIVNNFFTSKLEKPDFDEIFRIYPDLKDPDVDYSRSDMNFTDIFNKRMLVVGVKGIGINEYEVNWTS